jgi:hypothetical protein
MKNLKEKNFKIIFGEENIPEQVTKPRKDKENVFTFYFIKLKRMSLQQ